MVSTTYKNDDDWGIVFFYIFVLPTLIGYITIHGGFHDYNDYNQALVTRGTQALPLDAALMPLLYLV